jgi:hypothetical protein
VEQTAHGSFPLVVWIMREQPQADRLAVAIRRHHHLDERLFRVTTHDDFADLIAEGAT